MASPIVPDGDDLPLGSAVTQSERVEVPAALAGLFPDGGLARGEVVCVPAAGYVTNAMIAAAVAERGWAAVAGVPDLGVKALLRAGAVAERVLLVPDAGPRWAEVAAVLAEGVDLLVLRPGSRPGAGLMRRLSARWRQSARSGGAAVVVIGEWEGARLRLEIAEPVWHGLSDGFGHLYARQVRVLSRTRGHGTRPRVARVWLPAPDGGIAELGAFRAPIWQPEKEAQVVAAVEAAEAAESAEPSVAPEPAAGGKAVSVA